MLGHPFAYSAAPVRKVKEVQFGILSPEEIVRGIASCAAFFADYLYRKPILWRKSSFPRLWTKLGISQRWEGWQTLDWEQLIEITSARHVAKGWQNVLVTLVILS